RDGAWAASDGNINRRLLTKGPSADHNAMLDPSCPDITARVLEALGYYGYHVGDRQVDRAVAFLRRTQEPAGCWLGRWGVNYIYGTWQVLEGLARVGFDPADPMVRRAARRVQAGPPPGGARGGSRRSHPPPPPAGARAP